jgi:SAM-dependent methyltransferase
MGVMTQDAAAARQAPGYRFYGDLAVWWPLISPPAEYREEAAQVAALLRTAAIEVREVLELGSGGGHNAVHLRRDLDAMTLVDLSPEMLAVSRELNPDCEHVRADMRDVRLGRSFDAVFVHDAVDYMLTEADLRRAMQTAFEHCRPGGVAVFVPDETAETFRPGTDHGGTDGADGRGVRYLEWSWDPDPADTLTRTEYTLVFRDPDGRIRVVHETHTLGVFGRDVWLRLLGEVGFEARAVTEKATWDGEPRELFVGHRPSPADPAGPQVERSAPAATAEAAPAVRNVPLGGSAPPADRR